MGASSDRGVRRAVTTLRDLHVRGTLAHLCHELECPLQQEVPPNHRLLARAVPQLGQDCPTR